ncbi:ABC transporter ATP-binding protein [Succinivibrio sp.]|uniref:ABC transporter ATP-binding protein n=1 Tax=Succinivibrio sp. TaxID=2053619 RepID=UPI00258BB887|nr:ABC transporter ATP-binding protein [Succinivibrio sp.]MCI6938629.1 ABC transporter ATP-binding protein [Succinatimonas hippei]MDD6206699.1 ABC transporter ATP-binding protein [Succinivibrio sp.]
MMLQKNTSTLSAQEDKPLEVKPGQTLLDLVNVCRDFDQVKVIKKVNLQIKKNEFFTLVGPSGSGKTTILKMLAGMDQPTSGDIVLGNESISALPPDKRPTCMVFQFLALFPHMTVGQNIEFPMRVKGISREKSYEKATKLMQLVHLPEDYYNKNVMKCSGGERQRVAIARALAYDSEIILFDEPLSAIDAKLRKTLQKDLKDLHRRSGKTFIYITHSLEEAMFMSDRVGVLCKGELKQVGTPEEIYAHPVSRFVAEFIGDVNIFKVRMTPEGVWESPDLPKQSLKVKSKDKFIEGYIIVRPEALKLIKPGVSADNTVECKILNQFSLGSRSQLQLSFGKKEITLELPRSEVQEVGDSKTITVGWDVDDAIFVTE